MDLVESFCPIFSFKMTIELFFVETFEIQWFSVSVMVINFWFSFSVGEEYNKPSIQGSTMDIKGSRVH